ncbi:RNA 2',3'-cyclic phosphodiesterase [Nocardioides sp.]|uniref:RNA 2',3'-cyclic phosphodiesterase n=1 Tax=Nocardioides sp. TaxID=35761 RepID=UPI0035148855
MRIFAALLPDEITSERLEELLDVRRDAEPAWRWTMPEQWHVTLAFAGAAPARRVDDVVEALTAIAAATPPPVLRPAGAGAFPHPDAAKVLWLGVVPADGPEERLGDLAAVCRTAFARHGVEVDGTRFRPHLTVARSGRGLSATRWLRVLDTVATDLDPWRPPALHLLASHLGEGPRRRPRYETLAALEWRR